MTAEVLTSAQQKLETGPFVRLFTLDLTSLGGGVLYWTPDTPKDGEQIVWQGKVYTSVDIDVSGFEKSTTGTLPRPQVSISNVDNIAGALVSQYGDLKGCTVTRTRTLYECLDGQPEADPTAMWPVDIYRVERKVTQNKIKIVLELASVMDNVGAKVPARVLLRDICTWIYRRWDGEAFDYTRTTCPYAGEACFTALGVPCAESKDTCGKRVSDCKLRFPGQPLPFGGFPGATRT